MELNVFLEYPVWGIVGVLSSFGHEQYPSKRDVNLWCLITKYLNEGIGFLVVLVGLCNTPSCVKIYVMEPNVFLGHFKNDISSVLSSFGHEQYLSDSLYRNNSAHGVYNVT
jgi:hypothetical protein